MIIRGLLKVLTMLVGMVVSGLLLLVGSTITFLPAFIAFVLTILFVITV